MIPTIKTKLLWNMSPQRRELVSLREELKHGGLDTERMKRWSYLEKIEKEMEKVTI